MVIVRRPWDAGAYVHVGQFVLALYAQTVRGESEYVQLVTGHRALAALPIQIYPARRHAVASDEERSAHQFLEMRPAGVVRPLLVHGQLTLVALAHRALVRLSPVDPTLTGVQPPNMPLLNGLLDRLVQPHPKPVDTRSQVVVHIESELHHPLVRHDLSLKLPHHEAKQQWILGQYRHKGSLYYKD